jgi:multidrug efflux system outer membrane protein
MSAASRACALVGCAFLGACAVGPDYLRPGAVAAMPGAFGGPADGWKSAAPRERLPRGDWWTLFRDATLDRLEHDAIQGSQRLKVAAARFAQARATTDVARSGLFPRIGAGVTALSQQDSADRPLAMTGKAAGSGFSYGTFSIPFDLSWEPDLWGRVRRQLESARAREAAEAAELESVQLSLTAEVAADYFALAALDDERRLLSSGVEGYRQALDLVRARKAAGLVSDLDVAQADTALRSAEALLPPNALARARFEHALAALTGQAAPLFHLPEGPTPAAPPEVPQLLPSELLERRPDIAAAERRMASANAGVGLAESAFYPSIRLGATAGVQSIALATLFTAPSILWALGGFVTTPLFDAGQRQAGLATARAAWDEAVARYRETVLNAFAEVEDNLAAQRLLAEEYDRLQAAAAAAHLQEAVARARYGRGLVSYLPVVTAQALALERDRAVVRSRGQRSTAAVALLKSLGGSWEQSPGPERAP